MPGLVVKVDDRVILSSVIAAGLLYFGLAWHRAFFVARSSASAGAARGDGDEQWESSAADSEQKWASRLLECHFASVHDSERPFREDLLIQAAARANDEFAPALALMVERRCAALTDFTGELEQPLALVLGCGVGGAAVALAQSFPLVLAVDSSQRCIDAAKALQEQGCLSYRSVTSEGAKGPRRLARLQADIDASRISYMRADTESFVEEMEAHSADAVVVAGLLTRLPRPAALLGALARLLRPGGVVAVETDYCWAPALTAPPRQLAAPGAGRAAGQQGVGAVMEAAGFQLAEEGDRATATRLSDRRLCLSVHHCSVWRLRDAAG